MVNVMNMMWKRLNIMNMITEKTDSYECDNRRLNVMIVIIEQTECYDCDNRKD